MAVEEFNGRVALDIHLEGLKPKNFKEGDVPHIFREILKDGSPVIISPSLYNYKDGQWDEHPRVLSLTRELVFRDGSFLGQQGYTHFCTKHKITDSWHEFWCIWKPWRHMGVDEQANLMRKGKKELEELFENEVSVFVPPNHYFDQNTLEAARQVGYGYFMNKAMIPVQPYNHGEMIVVPEGDLQRDHTNGRKAVYIHYDEIDKSREQYEAVIGELISLGDIQTSRVGKTTIKLNNIHKKRI